MIRLKSAKEIGYIREAGRIAAETLKALSALVEEGITTLELDKFTYNFITKHGGRPSFLNYMGFPNSLCASVNQEVIHGIPGKRKLKNGDIIGLDLGVELKGYYSDISWTYAVGRIDEEVRKLMMVTQECLSMAIEKAQANNRINDIARAVFEHATNNGYGVVRKYCGHGVGFSQHEEPQVPNYVGPGPNPRLKAGMVLALEPMINMGTGDVVLLEDGWTVETADKKVSAHYEHTIAVFPDHTEVLTALD